MGAGIENPDDLTPLRPFLSSSEMILFLDNAESILDPACPDAREIYTIVEELTRFDNICLGITSRISTVPPHCKRPVISTLTMESACDIFYSIYTGDERSDIINDLVRRLDFHALSITLLATVASHSMWDYDRLAKEWETQRTQVLRRDHNESLATTIELTLASQTFRKLTPSPSPKSPKSVGSSTFRKLIPSTLQKPVPSAREVLQVVAFFPQGINENNLDWLFPIIPDRKNLFDQFCILSLTYRSNGFITMLAPIRDYLGPRDPKSSPLLRATKDRYFNRLSVDVGPNRPGFGETQWIVSEDVNVEHLVDSSISVDPTARDSWDACHYFLQHLYWHKPRQTVLGPKIEALSDGHPSKSKCLSQLSQLSGETGNQAERKRLLTHTLKLGRRKGDRSQVGETLKYLSNTNRLLGLHEEGIQQAKEALAIFEKLGNKLWQAICLAGLAWLLLDGGHLDAAIDAASRAIDLCSEKDQGYRICGSHRLLGNAYCSKGERAKAIHHFETALKIASPFDWHDQLFWTHCSLAELFLGEDNFDNANVHIQRAKSHALYNPYYMNRAMETQARVWYRQGKFEDAKSEASPALESYEKLGAAREVESCRGLLQKIEQATRRLPTPAE